jgi:acetyl esterase/lipase
MVGRLPIMSGALALTALAMVACSTEASPPAGSAVTTGATAPESMPAATVELEVRYGESPSQFGRLRMPAGVTSPTPVVVLLHGGFWRAQYGLDLMEPLAVDLVDRGYATWNIEYRRVGEAGGGSPGTFADVAAAIDELSVLAETHPLDLTNVVLIGHSAGGQLALWAAGREAIEAGQPGAAPMVVPRLAIALGPVADLRGADEAALGNDAVAQFLGGHVDEDPDRYAAATPPAAAGVTLVVVRATEDAIVPAEFTESPSTAGAELIDTHGDHFALIDPTSQAWVAVIAVLVREVPSGS